MATGLVYEPNVGWRPFSGGDIPASGVTAGTYGDATHVSQVAVDAGGRITSASNVAISASAGVSSLDSITGAVTLVAGSGVSITDNSPSAGDITIAASGGGGSSLIGSTSITASVNIASTTEATPTLIIDAGSLTFDGNPVLMEFFCWEVDTPTNAVGASVTVALWEGTGAAMTTEITRLCQCFTQVTSQGRVAAFHPIYQFSPSAGTHDFKVAASASSLTGTPAIRAGAGGAAAFPPAILRFTKV